MTNEPNKHPMVKLKELVLRARKNQQKREEEELEKKKTPLNYEEELKRHEEIHKRAAILDKEEEENWKAGKSINMPKKNQNYKHPMSEIHKLVMKARANNPAPLNYEEELKRTEEMHKRAAILDKEEEENWRTGKSLNMPKK